MKRFGNNVHEIVRSVLGLFIRSCQGRHIFRKRRGSRRRDSTSLPAEVMLLETRQLLSGLPVQFLDPHPVAGNGFGSTVVALGNGNVVITSPNDNAGGTAAGAVYLFNGQTGALISTLTGSHPNDDLGSDGIKVLTNGNFVIDSPNWNGNIGAVTFVNGITGLSGTVSSSNSLVGSTANDKVGSGGVTLLTNGAYIVDSSQWNGILGAVTFGNETTGITGTVSSSNSLVGTTANDGVGNLGITALTNGNYVVDSDTWLNGAVAGAGAITWGNGVTGITGKISSSNSLIGTTANDDVGNVGITALVNGNYVVESDMWHNGGVASAGAVTWGNGTSGVTGTVSSNNSLVGTTTNDVVGVSGVTALMNGNYVVDSDMWNNGSTSGAGAVTWGNGATGITGAVSSANSLVGTSAYDEVGYAGVTALTNGNYVVDSYVWNANSFGAITFGNGTTGISGAVSSTNSLVGTSANDEVGFGGVTVLTNGNYVVDSYIWSGAKGAVTLGNGTSGVTGTVSSTNSLVGSSGDQVGVGGIVALTNGNYVVDSYDWNGNRGAVTFENGTTGVTGTISSSNSLVGSTGGDQVGIGGIAALTNGDYVVDSDVWNGEIGAVTWADGVAGITGAVSSSNSLVGSTANDEVGSIGVTPLMNGNYVVDSDLWNGDRGAATWGNGTMGITGAVSSSNSLVGSSANDEVGNRGITKLANGNYVVDSSDFYGNLGAATFGYGTAGITGTVTFSNSVVGHTANDFGSVITDNAQNSFYVSFPADMSGIVYGGSSISGFFGPPIPPNGESLESFLIAQNGTEYVLTAIGNVYSMTAGSTSWTAVDSNVTRIALAGNGDVVDLHGNGALYETTAFRNAVSFVQIDSGVVSFAIAGNGDVVDLHAGGGVYEFTAYRSASSAMQLDSGVTSLAIAGNGDVVDLHSSGELDEFTMYRNGSSSMQIDGGVKQFQIAGNGLVEDLHFSSAMYIQTSFRSAVSQQISQFQ